jgi:hypothetical protein
MQQKKLAVGLNLNVAQRDVLILAVKGKPFNPFTRTGTIEVNAENVLQVREAVVDLFRKKFAIKTKTAQIMETCFLCERIIDKIDNVLDTFGYEAPPEPTNDNEMGIVSITVPSRTVVEEEEPHYIPPTEVTEEAEKAIMLLEEQGDTSSLEEYRELIQEAVSKRKSKTKKSENDESNDN